MTSEILIALLSLLGTLGGSAMGAIASGKLTSYRLRELEKKVDEHNNYARRMPVLEEKMKVTEHRLSDLEEKGNCI